MIKKFCGVHVLWLRRYESATSTTRVTVSDSFQEVHNTGIILEPTRRCYR